MKNKSVDFPLWGKCKYSGEINSCDQPHGFGTAVGGNGYRNEGTFQDGSLVTGKRFEPDGFLMYEGECKGGRAHGTGKWFYRGGRVGTGRWEESSLIDGTYTYPDGRVVQVVNGEEV